MKKLIDLTNGQPRVFIELKTPHAKAEFLKQAEAEGFMIGDQLPTQCRCDSVMIIHSDYTITRCVGMTITLLYHSSQSIKCDFEAYMAE